MTILIGVDQGTSGTRTVAFDERPAAARPRAYRPAQVSHPQPGWIEKDADETVRTVEERWPRWSRQLDADRSPPSGSTTRARRWWRGTPRRLRAAGAGDRLGLPSRAADRRAAGGGRRRRARSSELSGLPLDPYFSATKIRWLVENDDGGRDGRGRRPPARRHAGRVRLRPARRRRPHRAVDGRAHAAAGAAAPGTLGPRAARLHGVDAAWLPPIGPSAGDSARWRACRCAGCWSTRPRRWPATAACCRGMAKATYGTGIFLLQQAGQPRRPRGWRACCRWSPGSSRTGRTTLRAGRRRVLRRNRDRAGCATASAIDRDSGRDRGAGESVPDTGGVQVPAGAGRHSGAPWWRADARAVFAGITAGHDAGAHRARRARRALLPRARHRRRAAGAAGRRCASTAA